MAKLCQRVGCTKPTATLMIYCPECTLILRERDRRVNGNRYGKARNPKTVEGGQAGRTIRQRHKRESSD